MRSYYFADIQTFLKTDDNSIIGQMAQKHHHTLEQLQKNAWLSQIQILKNQLQNFLNGYLFFEFSIPRMGKRVDNIVIVNDVVFVLEFKVGDRNYHKYAIEQAMDYALDLKNFHEGSHSAKIIPILVSTNADDKKNSLKKYEDNVFAPIMANSENIGSLILEITLEISEDIRINAEKWANSVYKPTPTIIEAAQALYRRHSVKEISRSDAGAINLSVTASCINAIIETSKKNSQKSICFVTGVPGAGKTLAGLNIANERMNADTDEHAVFLSGNGPLVTVLREALVRDEILHSRAAGKRLTKKEAAIKANAFIQNIHHFRDEYIASSQAPTEKVVIFDEAQRAWTKEQASSFMRRKRGKDDFDMSEPEFLIDVMNRHNDWCVVICLIGGGQEINTGEAGIEEWIFALKQKFSNWNIYHSSQISSNMSYVQNSELIKWLAENAKKYDELHLSVSVRSFRSEKLSSFIHALLELNLEESFILYKELQDVYPITITRDIDKAKQWLAINARGSERYGLISSSGAKRLRPHGVDVKNEISVENWFLDGKDDIRSSFFMEDTATEFDIQGLEIDWACVCWGENFYLADGKWRFQTFKGSAFQNINSEYDKKYLKNSYRVLLTRARQGMVIFVPYGSAEDKTRSPEYYNETYSYLQSIGIKELD